MARAGGTLDMQDLIKVFDSLQKPETLAGTLNFAAAQLEGTPHRIGKDSSGWPALLLESSSEQRGAQIRLEHLEVQHFVRCRITDIDGQTEEGIYTVVRCIEADDELAHYFLHTVGPILRLLGNSPTFSEISRSVTYLVELFRALTQPPIKSVSGLWAELFVIRHSRDPKALVAAWHATPEEKYDFTSGNQRIEVKSSSQRKRIHHFSLEQLIPPSGCRAVVVSLFVERAGGGTSLRDLVEEIENELSSDPELQERLNRVIGLTLGNALRQGYASRFDRALAAESLKMFDTEVIPKISTPFPNTVSNIHFQSDLSEVEVLHSRELIGVGGIFISLPQ